MAHVALKQRHTLITSLWENGVRNAHTLHELTSILLSTVYKYIKKLKNNITLDPLPRTGRPKKLSPKKYRYLGQLISKNKFSTTPELANPLNENLFENADSIMRRS